MATGTIKKSFTDIVSATRIATRVATGATGNIALPYVNTGTTAIISPHVSGADYAIRAWVNTAGNWFLTVINPNTGATINNTEVNIRYWVFEFSHL